MKKTLLLSLLTTILFVSCDSNKDPFTIGEGSIGSLDKNIQMKQVDSGICVIGLDLKWSLTDDIGSYRGT